MPGAIAEAVTDCTNRLVVDIQTQPTDISSDYAYGHISAMDGDYVVVGDVLFGTVISEPPVDPQGRVVVFERTDALGLQQVAEFHGAQGDILGNSVAIDGNRIAVGANGYVRIIERVNGTWTLGSRIDSPDPSGAFGGPVALAGDYLFVSDEYRAVGGVNGMGSVYVYSLSAGGPAIDILEPDSIPATGSQPTQAFGRRVDGVGGEMRERKTMK